MLLATGLMPLCVLGSGGRQWKTMRASDVDKFQLKRRWRKLSVYGTRRRHKNGTAEHMLVQLINLATPSGTMAHAIV